MEQIICTIYNCRYLKKYNVVRSTAVLLLLAKLGALMSTNNDKK